ncbi:hypothetical protein HIM_01592 [Hirsutella minnesotensis 3608]|nr:hypothetical protein HIM_01592 [Hirsutella minnesotensis 3608]
MGAPEEHHSLLSGYPRPKNSPPTSRWTKGKTALKPSGWSKKKIFSVLAALSIAAVLLSGSCSSFHRKNWKFVDQDPVRRADAAEMQDLEWKPKDGCRDTPHTFPKFTTAVHFGGSRKLGIQETVAKGRFPSWRLPDVSGQVVLRPSTKNDTDGSIDLEIISNDENLRVKVDADFKGDDQRLKMTIPRASPSWPMAEGPCIQMRAVVTVPRKAYLRRFNVETVQLDVDVLDGLSMGVSDDIHISTVSGHYQTSLAEDANEDVVPYMMQSRRITVETVSAPITGWFPLYDGLKLSSSSGDITAQVGPKSGEHKAQLEVSTVSGQIKVTEPLEEAMKSGKPSKKLPARPYKARLSTVSGDLDARVASNCDADFHSISGELSIEVLPVLDKSVRHSGSIKTDTKSGDVRMTVLEPVWVDGDDKDKRGSLDRLESRYNSISGALQLKYPSSWRGRFHTEALSGDIEVHGKDVDIIRRGRSIGRYVDGRKGDGGSNLIAKTISGDVELTFG